MARRVSWTNNSSGHTGTYVYRAEMLDPQNLPAPVATVDPVGQGETADWNDTESLADGDYDYAVQDFDASNVGALSAVKSYTIQAAPSRGAVTIALVVADTAHPSANNTEQALVDAGFSLSNITRHQHDTAPPASDIIVICRAVDTQNRWDLVKPAWDAGTPVVMGFVSGALPSSGHSAASTFANLTGTFIVESHADGSGTDENEIINNTRYIASPFPLGRLAIMTGFNYSMSLDDDSLTDYVGTVIANADPDPVSISGRPALIEVPASTPDLLGSPTPANAVVWGSLYGGQSSYTQDGAELLARCIEWCLS